MTIITPVLLAGGSGTRLWPVSRKTFPKQFSNLFDGHSLFQKAALRLKDSEKLNFAKHITLTNNDYRFIVSDQLHDIGIDCGTIIIEPEGKNTAPAILTASLHAYKEDKESIILVAPSDHLIPDIEVFHAIVSSGLNSVQNNKIVTFGVVPKYPETGYGYLELTGVRENSAFKLKGFVEKPTILDAQDMFDKGNYLWNSGIFMFRAEDMIGAFKELAPNILEPVKKSLAKGTQDLNFLRLDSESWAKCEDISIDYAIMEHVPNLVAIPFNSSWSDLGGWNAVWEHSNGDENGVACSNNAHAVDCQNTLLRTENENQVLVGLGLTDIVVIAMPDAVLVSHKDELHNIKETVNNLKQKNIRQATVFPKDHRPWGWFETLAIQGRFQVKRIFVKPGEALSLQSHHHRSEHWIVVEGTAKVTVDDDEKLVTEGQSVYIPLGSRHRLENPGKLPMVLIEVQTGPYLEEDDIIRYEDIYSRI